MDKSSPASAWGHHSPRSWGCPGTVTLLCSSLSSAFGSGWCLVAWTDRLSECGCPGETHLRGTGRLCPSQRQEKNHLCLSRGKNTLWGSEQHRQDPRHPLRSPRIRAAPPGPSASSQVPRRGVPTLPTIWGFSTEWLICTPSHGRQSGALILSQHSSSPRR